ncbi:hypothetical protein FTI75_25140 [Burkholderia pseudomallei]|uniref:hypothetical protein n=1 Tax=Burkholderia pseudomallei TaxID=28450 RepID=UPI0011B9ED19|nr:hypothetical protein [Burkholderia pseudomallei]TXD01947.1 hypothetical protein FTI75_25140 [Burkholderia pseudomallei]
MAVKADVRCTTNRTLRVGDRRQLFGCDELGQMDVRCRDHVCGHICQLLVVHQQDVFDSGATTDRDFEGPGFLPGY